MRRDPKFRSRDVAGGFAGVAVDGDLFTMKHDGSGQREGTHNTLYYAQSWMVVHYLVNKNKMPETGTYFYLVLNQKVPVEKAMVQAFDMSPEEMEEAVKTYFKSLSGLGIALAQAKKPIASPVDTAQPDQFAIPFGGDDIGMAVSPVKDEEARAVIDDVMARFQSIAIRCCAICSS